MFLASMVKPGLKNTLITHSKNTGDKHVLCILIGLILSTMVQT